MESYSFSYETMFKITLKRKKKIFYINFYLFQLGTMNKYNKKKNHSNLKNKNVIQK